MSGVQTAGGNTTASGNGSGRGRVAGVQAASRSSIFAPKPSRPERPFDTKSALGRNNKPGNAPVKSEAGRAGAGAANTLQVPQPPPSVPSPARYSPVVRDSKTMPIYSAFSRPPNHALALQQDPHRLRHAVARFYPAGTQNHAVDIAHWEAPVVWRRVNPAVERAEREKEAKEREKELKEALEARKAAEKAAKLETQGKFGIVLPPGLRVPAGFKTEVPVKSEPSSVPVKSEESTSVTLAVPDPPAQNAPRPRKQGSLYTPRPPSPTDPRTSNPAKVTQWLSRMPPPRRAAVVRGFPVHTSDARASDGTVWEGELVGGTAIVPGVTGQVELTGPRGDGGPVDDLGVDQDGQDKPAPGRPDPPTHFAMVLSADRSRFTVVPVYGTYAFRPKRSAVSVAGFAIGGVKREGGAGRGGGRDKIGGLKRSALTAPATGEFGGLLGPRATSATPRFKPDPDADPNADPDDDPDADADQLVLTYLGATAARGAPTKFALARAGLLSSGSNTKATSGARRARARVRVGAAADEDADFAALDARSDDEEFMGGEGEEEWDGSGGVRREGEEREREKIRIRARAGTVGDADGLFGSASDSDEGHVKQDKFTKDGKRLAKRLKRHRATDRQSRSGEPSSDEEDDDVGGDWASAFLKSKGVGVDSDEDDDGGKRKPVGKDDRLTDIGAGREELKRREREARKKAKEAEKARNATPAGPKWSGPTSGGGLGGAARVTISGTSSASGFGISPPVQRLASPGMSTSRAPSPSVPRGPSPPTSRAASPPIPRPGTPSRAGTGWASPGISRPTSPIVRAGSPLAHPPTPGRATSSTPVAGLTSSRGPSPTLRGPSPVMRATSPRRPGSPPQSPPYSPGGGSVSGSGSPAGSEEASAGRGKKRKVDELTGGASSGGRSARRQGDLSNVVMVPGGDGPLTDADIKTAISLQPSGACTARQLLHALKLRMAGRPDSKDEIGNLLRKVAVGKKEGGVIVFRVKVD